MESFESTLENTQEFRAPNGFTLARDLGMTLHSIEDYTEELHKPEPGTWNQENGVIAAVTSTGDIVCWIPMSDPSKNELREVPYDAAINNLQEHGYREGSFSVPRFLD